MPYLYLATDHTNSRFNRRGQIKSPQDAVGFASQMAKYGLEVYCGPDLDNPVGRATLLDHATMVEPNQPRWVVNIQKPVHVGGKAVYTPAWAQPLGFWARLKWLFTGRF